MPAEDNIYEQLLQKGFSKRDIDAALHKTIMQQMKEKKQHAYLQQQSLPSSASLKKLDYIKNIWGKALCLLKTLFAKKPKNPV